MVGGKVIEVCNVPGRNGVLFVNCADRPYKKIETCAILVEDNETSQKIQVGDSLWWQGWWAMWTPQASVSKDNAKCGVDYDIRIPKVSGSGITLETAMGKSDD